MSASVLPTAPASFSPGITEPVASPRTCPNCNEAAFGAFCHSCGGRVEVARLTIRAMGGEILSQVIELDHGVLHTFVALIRRPGETIRGYFAGRRRGLTSPLAFVTLSVALTLLLANVIPSYMTVRDEQIRSLDQYRTLYSPAQYDYFVRIEHDVMQDKALMLVLLLVPTTLTMRFLFRKQKLNLAEMGTLVCYLTGTSTFVGLLIGLPAVLMGMANAEMTLALVTTFVVLIHFSYGMFGRSFRTTWRALWAFFCGMLLMQAALIAAPYIVR